MLWAMLIVWLAQGRPRYVSQEGSIAYISDIGASGLKRPQATFYRRMCNHCFVLLSHSCSGKGPQTHGTVKLLILVHSSGPLTFISVHAVWWPTHAGEKQCLAFLPWQAPLLEASGYFSFLSSIRNDIRVRIVHFFWCSLSALH